MGKAWAEQLIITANVEDLFLVSASFSQTRISIGSGRFAFQHVKSF